MAHARANFDPITFSLPSVGVQGAFRHAEEASTDSTRALVAKMIADDAHDNHVFINEIGFHNHLIHMILADYSLGASPERLKYDTNRYMILNKLIWGEDKYMRKRPADNFRSRALGQ